MSPPRMITSEQTVERTGLRMKVSTNMGTLAGWRDGNTVGQALHPRGDHALAWLQPFLDHVFVPDERTHADQPLLRDESCVLLVRDVHEVLAADSCHGQRRNRQRRIGAPDHPSADE